MFFISDVVFLKKEKNMPIVGSRNLGICKIEFLNAAGNKKYTAIKRLIPGVERNMVVYKEGKPVVAFCNTLNGEARKSIFRPNADGVWVDMMTNKPYHGKPSDFAWRTICGI